MPRDANRTVAARQRRWRTGIAAMGLLLVLTLAGVAWLQARQYEALNGTRRYQDDYLVWSLFQFETEYLKLRLALEQAAGPSVGVDPDQVAQRYEIFVSRLNLVESEHAAQVLAHHPDYQRTVARAQDFVRWADALPLNGALIREHPQRIPEIVARLEPLADPIRDLSLTSTHHVAQDVTRRNEIIRNQSRVSLGLTAALSAMTLLFAAVIYRQFRGLERYGDKQKALAARLNEAQREADAANRAKTVFLANMSHELRTPLQGLLGMLGLIKEAPLTAAQQDQLKAANDCARHLLAVLGDILDVTRMEAGGLSIAPEPLQLGALVKELEALSRPQAAAKRLALHFGIDDDVPGWVLADPTRLRQILLNLLSNALKFCDRGQVGCQLRRGVGPLGEDLLMFEVSDTGPGIDAETQARLFQRFSQGDASTSRRHGGAGLGLEISRRLARAMGGDIHVQSAPGQGARFTLALPLRAGADQPPCRMVPASEPAPHLPAAIAASTPSLAPSATDATPTGLRVLVSEDNPTNRIVIEAMLERLGHRPTLCENGLQALHALRQQPFDVVLMDLHTPQMDGFEATRLMRELPPPRGRLPIIAFSADAFEESRQKADDAGISAFLAKPVELETLRACLQSLAPSPARPEAA
ncbi:hybrid sensor histidine kinase/response regulator [Roseateles chitinivorans]|uniref:Virulence sensor protein BvgS n=1 Tax=Roseateles chitinivorans TaxID=2917965 RepID=A0A2G9CBW1_9BURK|nr:ATP-binding protein [Roseateles chitinivorans]PIM53928.1 hybrid sensor histidine kinase/response regulator [Roseateles chitinivorans]